MIRSLLIPAVIGLWASVSIAAPKAETSAVPDARRTVLTAVVDELDRSMAKLRLADNEPPYFIGLQVKEYESRNIGARYGALTETEHVRYRNMLADVRVGSYAFDSTPDPDAFGFDMDFDGGGYAPTKNLAVEDDAKALRRGLWLVVDEQYKRALSTYLKKRGKRVYKPDERDKAASFSKEKPVQYVEPAKPFPFDEQGWSAEARKASAQLLEDPAIFDSEVNVKADKIVRWFASSEGTRLVTEQVLYALHVNAWTRADDGMLLENGRDFYAPTQEALPRGEALAKELKALAEELKALRVAPVIDPFTGPTLLSPEATGVLFHETVGHRLEGDRQDDENEGRTFKGQIGKGVLPSFISVIDDPTLESFALAGKPVGLNGFYRYDEQGVAAQKVTLVDDGVLRGFLLGRRMAEGFATSNGHGRSASNRMPVARMANLLVKPSKTVPDADLKKMLLEEVRKRGKPYGIYVKDISGGNTNTSSLGYQAFKGTSRLVYRIHPDGHEELVRGVEIVGTPLSSINRILAMGDRYAIFNGFCGAESGYVPVSTVAPAALIGEFELQRTRKDIGRPPILPAP